MHVATYVFRVQRIKEPSSVNGKFLRFYPQNIKMPRSIRFGNFFLHDNTWQSGKGFVVSCYDFFPSFAEHFQLIQLTD